MELGTVKELEPDLGVVRDDLQLGNVYHNPNENFGNVYQYPNENFGNVYQNPNENFGNVYHDHNQNLGNIYEDSNQDNVQGQVRDDLQLGMVNAVEDSMELFDDSGAEEPMDSQSNENNLLGHDPRFILTYKDGASFLKQKKDMTYGELAEKVLLESNLAIISCPPKDPDERDVFISATTTLSQRLKDLMKKWKKNYRGFKEAEGNKVLFDLVSFSFFFILKTCSMEAKSSQVVDF